MSETLVDLSPTVVRVGALIELFNASGLSRLVIERADERVEIARRPRIASVPFAEPLAAEEPHRIDRLSADLVGIVRLSRPMPLQGETLAGDRELAYVEALGIRNPVRSRGAGRIVAIPITDGQVVDYGQTLFEIDRG
ncbi:MAG: acetyl-CoA carboxylase biotin carboxyl carrier protein [Vulcanimicrobiaceae bacterium]